MKKYLCITAGIPTLQITSFNTNRDEINYVSSIQDGNDFVFPSESRCHHTATTLPSTEYESTQKYELSKTL